MPRPRRCRRVGFYPDITYFKPAGIRKRDLEESTLTVAEFEAIRLKDLLGLEQTEAANQMNISQPTFHRLVRLARKKIADAIVNGKAIKIEGGAFRMANARPVPRGRGMGYGGPASTCICPSCGYEEPKVMGVRCVSKKCPKCGTTMVRAN
jgi:predicted DNA-binding protein (UPF0251 family)